MANKYRGECALKIGDQQHLVQFTWQRLAELRAAFGEDYDTKLSHACQTRDLEVLAGVLMIGLQERLTKAEIMDASPPVLAVINAIVGALNRAYFGDDRPPLATTDADDDQDQSKKKT